MTNEIAIDASRLSVQILKREKRLIGQAAVAKGYRSVGDYVRTLIQIGMEIEDKDLAQRYRQARLNRFARNISLVAITSLVLWQSIFSNQDMVRRLPNGRLAKPRKEEVIA